MCYPFLEVGREIEKNWVHGADDVPSKFVKGTCEMEFSGCWDVDLRGLCLQDVFSTINPIEAKEIMMILCSS